MAWRAAGQPATPSRHTGPVSDDTTRAQPSAEQINETIRYAGYSVFAATERLPAGDRSTLATEVAELLGRLGREEDLVVRGWYDLGGMTADADLMVWWHAPRVETVQRAYHGLRRSRLGEHLDPVWSPVGLHRPAEFNRGHVPAFMAGEEPRAYLCVYPFVRSYEWYLLPDSERRDLLVEHGVAAKPYPDVRANTVSTFALSDYEWLLAFEADELHRIVDLMRDLRATGARRHVREELPFWTGPRVELADLVANLP